jgi:hypothetical protein
MNLQEQISRIQSMMGLLKEEEEISISDMVRKDQEMRQGKNFDTSVDFSNQENLKKLLGEDPQKFLESLNTKEDVEGVWLIAQHADNNIELQKMILDLLDTNKDMLSQKFNIPIQEVLYGIAMLTDRVMVNSSTSLKDYRDNEGENFSEVTSGVQKYGTQGGVHNGSWLPRPIELDGQTVFFQTPEELYDNQEFLMKINKLRSEVGLPPLEDYVKNMQQYAQ